MVSSPPLIAVYKSNLADNTAPSVSGAVYKTGDWVFVLALTGDSWHRLGTPSGPPVGNPGWTLLHKLEPPDFSGAYLWYAKVTADWTGTISMPVTQEGFTYGIFNAYRYDGRSAGLGASVASEPGPDSALSLTINTQREDSAILFCGGDWYAQAWSGPTFRLPSGSSPAISDGNFHTDRANLLFARHNDAGPAGAKVVGLTTPTNWRNTAIAVEVLGDTIQPGPVSNLQAVLSSETSVLVTWDPATDNAGIASYKIYNYGVEIANVLSTSPRSYTHSGLAAETSYQYTVRAVDTSGLLGGMIDSKTITTPAQRIKLGSDRVKFMLGSTPIAKIYLGSNQILS